jgi:DNA repair exonuclease SbcCD nuclease subunit
MPTTIAHLADLHFGFNQLSKRTEDGSQNQREADFERAALLAGRYITEELRPDLTVVAGDVTHATRISTPGLRGARHFCHLHRDAGIPLVISPGNHDHVQSPVPPMIVLLQDDGAIVHLDQTALDIAGVRLHLVPFRSLERGLRGGGWLDEFEFSGEQPNILVAHGSVEGFNFRQDEVEIPSWWIEDDRFALICLGHIHERQRLGETRAFYSGALERLNFGERNEVPGFYVHSLDDAGVLISSREVTIAELAERYEVPFTPRPMLQWKINAADLTLEELDEQVRAEITDPAKVDGAMAKLVVSNVSAAFTRESYRKNWLALFSEAGGLDLEPKVHTSAVESLLGDGDFAAPPVDLAEGFADFMGEQELVDDDRAALVALGREILSAAHEMLIASEG